jgi:sugar phosphate isomerase/epimerase
LDIVNITTSPYAFYHNAQTTNECFDKLGPYVKSCHAKDIVLSGKLTVHLNEAAPGQGGFDFAALIKRVMEFGDIPLLMEHMNDPADVERSGAYMRTIIKAVTASPL